MTIGVDIFEPMGKAMEAINWSAFDVDEHRYCKFVTAQEKLAWDCLVLFDAGAQANIIGRSCLSSGTSTKVIHETRFTSADGSEMGSSAEEVRLVVSFFGISFDVPLLVVDFDCLNIIGFHSGSNSVKINAVEDCGANEFTHLLVYVDILTSYKPLLSKSQF